MFVFILCFVSGLWSTMQTDRQTDRRSTWCSQGGGVRISLRAGETFCAFAVSVELPSGTLKRSPQAMLTAYRRTAVLLLASIFCCWCHFGESRQRRNGRCNIQKFERKLATEMHDLFEDAFNKHGCNGYSDMHCSAQGGADGLECFLKKAVPLPEGPMCRPDLLHF